jgi:hypothetical protein
MHGFCQRREGRQLGSKGEPWSWRAVVARSALLRLAVGQLWLAVVSHGQVQLPSLSSGPSEGRRSPYIAE